VPIGSQGIREHRPSSSGPSVVLPLLPHLCSFVELVRRGGFVVKKRLKIFQNFVPQFPNIEAKTRNGREQAQIGNNNKSVAAENTHLRRGFGGQAEQSRTIGNFETCSFRRLLAVTRHQFAFCVADPVRSVQTEWQFDSSERPQKICINLRNRGHGMNEIEGKAATGSGERVGRRASFNSLLVSPIRVIRAIRGSLFSLNSCLFVETCPPWRIRG
jgi:hypothetical protein